MATIDPRTLPDLKQINTFDDADEALFQIGKLTASLQEQEAEMNTEIQSLRDKYDEKTIEARSAKEQLEQMLEKFVLSNRKEFRDERSRESTHGIIGLRLGKQKTELVSKKFTWKKVLDLLRDTKWGKEFIRQTPDVNKDALIVAFNDKKLNEKKLAEIGVKVTQDDNFYYTINWDNLN